MDVPAAQTTKLVRFGLFEVDLERRILTKSGLRVKVQNQPFRVLLLLLERPGDVVTREEIRAQLWPANTFVEFDDGLNTAIRKLRTALGDSSANPRFIETVPRHGYRLLAPTIRISAPQTVAGQDEPEEVPTPTTTTEIVVVQQDQVTSVLSAWNRLWPAAVALLLCLSVIWLLVRSLHRGSQSPQISITPLTSFPGLEAYPSFSPDGNQIVFVWDGGDTAAGVDLYLKQVGSEVPRRLTNHPARYLVPAWSPDGQFIAFSRTDEKGTGIYLIPPLGGPERKLTDAATMYWLYGVLGWSADAKWIAYPDVNDMTDTFPFRSQIHLLNIQTLENRTLPRPSKDCEASWVPAFSPDGRLLATGCVVNVGIQRIYVQSTNGIGAARQVALLQGDFRAMTWSADSNSIIYSLDRWLWRVPATGGTPEKLLFASDALQPTTARSGLKLAYSQQTYSSSIWRLDLAGPGRALRPPTKLMASSRGQEDPRISPDGKYIAFDSWRSGFPEVWVCNADGSNPVQLTSFKGPMTGTPRWSPDSQQVVLDSRVAGHSQLYVVKRQGGPPQHLATGTVTAGEPFWSHDGKWIYFWNEKDGGIWKVPRAGGNSVRLTAETGIPQESPDGTLLYIARQVGERAELWSATTDGTDEHPLPGMPRLALADQWVPAQNGIYYIDANRNLPTLNFFDTSRRRSHHIANLQGLANDWGAGPSLSSDGRTLIYAENDLVSGDIMLVDGFR